MEASSVKTVVLGLGNVLHADDGAGAQAISRLRGDARIPKDVSLIEGGTLGLELLPYGTVVAETFDFEKTSVGLKADLPESR